MGKKGISKNKHSICIGQIQEYVLSNQETATEEVCEFFWRGKCSVLDLVKQVYAWATVDRITGNSNMVPMSSWPSAVAHFPPLEFDLALQLCMRELLHEDVEMVPVTSKFFFLKNWELETFMINFKS